MRWVSPITVASLGAAAACCQASTPIDGDGGRADAARDVAPDDGRAEASHAPDVESSEGGYVGPVSGPATLVASGVEILDERLCDLDGDGVGDNAVADLGPTLAGVFTAGLGAMFRSAVEERLRLMIHIPWVEQLAGPTVRDGLGIVFAATDADDPRDRTDDFSGEEPFYVNAEYVDPCGEPIYWFPGMEVTDGVVESEAGVSAFPMGEIVLRASGAQIFGTITPGARAAALTMCGYCSMADLGVAPGPDGSAQPSMLAALVLGGALFGMPSFPGLSPNVDVDGDGLESVDVDADGSVLRCYDGDGAAIEGEDCFRDPRIVDGFGMVGSLDAVSARVVGPEPGWQGIIGGACEDPPPETLWNYDATLDE